MTAPKKILIADDEPNIVISLEFLLQREGYHVSVARDGQQALAQLGKHTYGLVIADRDLPGIGGLDLLRSVRQRRAVAAQPAREETARAGRQARERRRCRRGRRRQGSRAQRTPRARPQQGSGA